MTAFSSPGITAGAGLVVPQRAVSQGQMDLYGDQVRQTLQGGTLAFDAWRPQSSANPAAGPQASAPPAAEPQSSAPPAAEPQASPTPRWPVEFGRPPVVTKNESLIKQRRQAHHNALAAKMPANHPMNRR